MMNNYFFQIFDQEDIAFTEDVLINSYYIDDHFEEKVFAARRRVTHSGGEGCHTRALVITTNGR